MSLVLKVDGNNPFAAFVATATTTAWNLIMVFVKPDGGTSDKSEPKPTETAPEDIK